jgi:hypothetical protein
MQDTRWDHGLKVTADGNGLIGHAGAVLLRLLADRTGLTGDLGPALARPRKSPQVDRGVALVSMAAAIALGATSMSDIEVLSQLEPVLGAPPSDTTIRRTLELADKRTLSRAGRARARARDRAWAMIEATPAGFPWLQVAGKALAGWLAIDLDATLVTARSDKEGAAPTWKKGYGFHPLGAWLANTGECLALMLRPGNAGSNTVADHVGVLDDARAQVPARFRSRVIVRVDGAGATHDLMEHLLQLSSPRRRVLFTCGWAITTADEQAIARRGPGRAPRARQARHRGHSPDEPRREVGRRPALDRPPGPALTPAGPEPHALREGHRLALFHHLHQHPAGRASRRPGKPPPAVHRRAAPPARHRGGRRPQRQGHGPAQPSLQGMAGPC